jgi:hypothetical protein
MMHGLTNLKKKELCLLYYLPRFCSEDIEFEVYDHTEKVNKFGETRAWTEENTGIDIVEISCEKVKWKVLCLGIWSSGRIL